MKKFFEIPRHALDSALHNCQLLQDTEWDPKIGWCFLLCCAAGSIPLQRLFLVFASAECTQAALLWSTPPIPDEGTDCPRLSDCSRHCNPILSHCAFPGCAVTVTWLLIPGIVFQCSSYFAKIQAKSPGSPRTPQHILLSTLQTAGHSILRLYLDPWSCLLEPLPRLWEECPGYCFLRDLPCGWAS